MPKLYRNDNDDNIQSLSFILIILYTKSWHGWSQKIRINFALWSKIRPPPKLGSLKSKSLTVKLILDAKNFQPGVLFIKFGAQINTTHTSCGPVLSFCRLLSFPYQHIFIRFGQIVVLVLYVQMITMTVMPRKNFTSGCFNHYCHLCHLSKMQLNHCAIVVLW